MSTRDEIKAVLRENTKKTTKTYVNVENENDVITVKREEMIYIFD